MAADIVNNLMIEYDSMTVEQNNHSNDQIIGFIRNRLNQMDQELDSLKLRFLKYKQDHKLYDVEKISGKAFANLTEAERQQVAQASGGFDLKAVLAWLVVGVPLGWGIWTTLTKAFVLFH